MSEDLSDLTVAELREEAENLGIDHTGMKKVDLIEAIEAAEAAEVEEPGDEGELVEIQKRMSGRWWCPLCGNEQATGQMVCEGCGAERVGTAVRAS